MINLILYTSDNCGACKRAKRYLTSLNINFIEKNISNDKFARKDLEDRYIMSIPVLVKGNWEDGIEGFSPNLYNEFLQKHNVL